MADSVFLYRGQYRGQCRRWCFMCKGQCRRHYFWYCDNTPISVLGRSDSAFDTIVQCWHSLEANIQVPCSCSTPYFKIAAQGPAALRPARQSEHAKDLFTWLHGLQQSNSLAHPPAQPHALALATQCTPRHTSPRSPRPSCAAPRATMGAPPPFST